METRMAMQLAMSFQRTTGLDLDDLFQQACLVYAEAEVDGKHDPTRMKFTSYVYMRMRSGLIGYCQSQHCHARRLQFRDGSSTYRDDGQERPGCGMDDWATRVAPPERGAEITEFLEHLDPDARTVCELVLDNADEYAPIHQHWHAARRRVKTELNELGWSGVRIARVLADVRQAVTAGLGGRLESRL